MLSSRMPCVAVLAFTALTLVAFPLRAQTPFVGGGISLFGDFDLGQNAERAYSGTIGGYGVSFAAVGDPAKQHGPALGAGVRSTGAASDLGALSLIGAYTVNQFRVAVDIRRQALDVERRRGSAELGIGFAGTLTEQLSVGGGPTIGFGEITPSRSPLRPGGGDNVRTLGLTGAATLSLSENWALTGVLGYRSRTDGAKEESFFSTLGLGYRF